MTPSLNKQFLCIVNHDFQDLTAVVSSYINSGQSYLIMFEFGDVSCSKQDFQKAPIKHKRSNFIAEKFAVRTFNALQHLDESVNVILVGLSYEQLSYLEFVNEFNVLKINDHFEAHVLLETFRGGREFLQVKSEDVLLGCYSSIRENKILKIGDETNIDFEISKDVDHDGIVLVEANNTSSSVCAVNYAISIGASFEVIARPTIGLGEIKEFIYDWKTENDDIHLNNLSVEIYPNIEKINFLNYSFATFFTYGIPYSLILHNCVPITHVNTVLRPDFFLFNGILRESGDSLFSSVIFSPRDFGKNEETDLVLKTLKGCGFYNRELVDGDATVFNLSNCIRQFPFELLHVCAHGGDMEGYSRREKFEFEGITYEIEFDEVVSFAPSKGEELVPVTTKYLPRKLNGFDFGSSKFKEQDYPLELHAFIRNNIGSLPVTGRSKVKAVQNSCGIICKDFFFQAMFNEMSGNFTNPVIFNNSCWSWSTISDSFLAEGASFYIGTLWNVSNDIAVKAAIEFYEKIGDSEVVLKALQLGMQEAIGLDKDVYAVWGLHFTTLKTNKAGSQNKFKIARKLLYSLNYWHKRLEDDLSDEVSENIQRNIKWLAHEISENFEVEAKTILNAK